MSINISDVDGPHQNLATNCNGSLKIERTINKCHDNIQTKGLNYQTNGIFEAVGQLDLN